MNRIANPTKKLSVLKVGNDQNHTCIVAFYIHFIVTTNASEKLCIGSQACMLGGGGGGTIEIEIG